MTTLKTVFGGSKIADLIRVYKSSSSTSSKDLNSYNDIKLIRRDRQPFSKDKSTRT